MGGARKGLLGEGVAASVCLEVPRANRRSADLSSATGEGGREGRKERERARALQSSQLRQHSFSSLQLVLFAPPATAAPRSSPSLECQADPLQTCPNHPRGKPWTIRTIRNANLHQTGEIRVHTLLASCLVTSERKGCFRYHLLC